MVWGAMKNHCSHGAYILVNVGLEETIYPKTNSISILVSILRTIVHGDGEKEVKTGVTAVT